MKTKIFVISVLFLFLVKSLHSQTGWFTPPGLSGNEYCQGMSFINVNTGFIGIGNQILKTTNSGNNWLTINTGISITIYSLSFINENTGWGSGNSGIVIKTTNGGLNWQQTHQDSSYYLWDIFFVDSQTGWLSCGSAYQRIKITTNGGMSWSYQLILPSLSDVRSLYFLNNNTGWATGEGGTYTTTNGGINWTINTGELGSEIFFINNLTGWKVGNLKISRSTNGGINWSQTSTFEQTPYCVYALNKDTLFTGLQTGLILRSVNGGFNWTTQISYSPTSFVREIRFLNNNTGFAIGIQGLILKTTTGGAKITHSVTGVVRFEDNNLPVTSGKVKAVKYDHQTQQIIILDSAVIQSNGTYILPNVPEDSVDIMAFQDDEDNSQFVPTYYPSTIYWQNSATLYPTSNLSNININVFRNSPSTSSLHIGGKVTGTYITESANVSDAFVYAKIGNMFKGYSVSNLNALYEINKLNTGTYEIIADKMGYNPVTRNVQLINSSLNNIDLSLVNYVISVDPVSEIIPEKYLLEQNYPNPFNPVTKIRFEIPLKNVNSSATVLKIYDLLGREIVTLVNEVLKPGKYDMLFDAGNLPSGVYFYRLSSGDFTDSKKMMILK